MSKANLKMLSEELNVSVSTVSKALRNSYEIGNETKKRVLETAEKMGYRPNPYAGFLRHHRSKTIALVIPELTNNFFIQAISGAETIAHEKDYHLLIYNTHDDFKLEESIIKDLQNGRVEGVIMSLSGTTTTYDHLNELILSNTPIVFFDRICHEIETAKISTDDFTSGFNATEHLIQNGCRDIAYLSVSETISIDNKRAQGYLEALNKHNIPINRSRIIKCGNDEKNNYKKIKQLLQSSKKPDGIFSSVEKLAITAYSVCNDLKIKIPDKVKIISFSNLHAATLLNPSLTSIVQPAFEMGKQAAIILFKHLGKKRAFIPNENIVIKSELVKRNSTANTNKQK
jgi:LacI family transcriptional regulator